MATNKCPHCGKNPGSYYTYTTRHGIFCNIECSNKYILDTPLLPLKLKHLIRKFGFKSILKECKKQNWKLPYAKDLIGQDLEYEYIWVKDRPEKLEDLDTHAMLYQHSTGKLFLCNKSFMQNIIVIKIKD